MSTAFEQAVAQMNANDQALLTVREIVEADPRYRALTAFATRPLPRLPHGMAGARAIFNRNASAANWRRLRAGALAQARRDKIMGYSASARRWIDKAAEHRQSEIWWREQEAFDTPITQEVAMDAFCAALTAPYATAAE